MISSSSRCRLLSWTEACFFFVFLYTASGQQALREESFPAHHLLLPLLSICSSPSSYLPLTFHLVFSSPSSLRISHSVSSGFVWKIPPLSFSMSPSVLLFIFHSSLVHVPSFTVFLSSHLKSCLLHCSCPWHHASCPWADLPDEIFSTKLSTLKKLDSFLSCSCSHITAVFINHV